MLNTPNNSPENQTDSFLNVGSKSCGAINRVKRGRPLGRKNNKTLKLNEKKKSPYSIMSGFVPDNCECSFDCVGLEELKKMQSELVGLDMQLEELVKTCSVLLDGTSSNNEQDDTNSRNFFLLHSTMVIQNMKERLDTNFEQRITELGKYSKQEIDHINVLRNPSLIALFRELVFNTPPIFRFSEFLETASPSWIEDVPALLRIFDDGIFFQKIRTGNDSIYIKETRVPKIELYLKEKKIDLLEYLSSISTDLPKLSEIVQEFEKEEHLFPRFPEARDCLVNLWILAILKSPNTTVLMSEFPKTFKETIDMGINELEHEDLIKFESKHVEQFKILKKPHKVLDKYGFLND